jgi:hypothetical protein
MKANPGKFFFCWANVKQVQSKMRFEGDVLDGKIFGIKYKSIA